MPNKDQPLTQTEWLTPDRAAELVGVSSRKIYTWIDSGELSAVDVNAGARERPRWRIRLQDLEAFIADRTKQ